MLNWKTIKEDKTFQLLVNDLFAAEINKPEFLSSSPYIGPDGGWDARFDGEYMGLKGLWSIQAKYTTKSLDDAYRILRPQIIKELEQAKKNKVKYLLIATNADLRVGKSDPSGKISHIAELEKLNEVGKYVENFFVWPKTNLEIIIKRHPWLRYEYFRDAQRPMFVPVDIFMKEEPLLEGEIIERLEDIKQYKKIFTSEELFLLIHAAGGYGKTHFIKEVARLETGASSNSIVFICRPQIRDVNIAINDELDTNKNYIIFLDDAERFTEEAQKLIAHAKTFGPGIIKIVFSCRTSGKRIVEHFLALNKVYSHDVIELSDLSEEGLKEVLFRAAETKKIKHPERIINELKPNLFLIATTGKFIKEGEIDLTSIKKKIRDELEKEAINSVGDSYDKVKVARLLRELSIIVPFSFKSKTEILEKLSEILAIEVEEISNIVDKLIESKVLRMIGNSIRFNPDMKGDIYLSTELDNVDGEKTVNQILNTWLEICSEKATANIAAALRHGGSDAPAKAIKSLVVSWTQSAKEVDSYKRKKRLEILRPLANLAPEEVIDLIYSYIDASSSEDNYQLGRDDYGPIIYQICYDDEINQKIIDLLLVIIDKDLKGTYNNYEGINIIRRLVSPIVFDFNITNRYIDELGKWIDNKDSSVNQGKLAVEAVKEALSGSHEYSESYADTITMGRKLLLYKGKNKNKVDSYRDNAMLLLKKIVDHPNDEIKILGIKAIIDIGDEGNPSNVNFWKRILSDKQQALNWLPDIVESHESNNKVISSIEKVLIRYWANNQVYGKMSDDLAPILETLPRSIEYLMFKHFAIHDFVITDFKEIKDSAPKKDRWRWIVTNYFSRINRITEDDIEELTKDLSKKYKTKEDIIEYLIKLDNEVQGIKHWDYIPLVEAWAKYNKDVFLDISSNKEDLSKTPLMFHRGIHRLASDNNSDYVHKMAKEILEEDEKLNPREIDHLLDLISRADLAINDFMPWLLEIIKKADSHTKHIILHRSFFIFKDRKKEERDKVVEILLVSLEGVVDSHVLDMFNFLLSSVLKWDVDENILEDIKPKIIEIIKNITKIDYHTDEIIKFVFGQDLDGFLNFVDYRLNKEKEYMEGKADKIDAIPFDGFKSLKELIADYDSFSKLADKVHEWRKVGVLYGFDIEYIFKHFPRSDKEIGDYIEHYVRKKIEKDNKEDLMVAFDALRGVPFGKSNADLFLEVLLMGDKHGITKEARDVFFTQVISGSYGGKIGEAPLPLVRKKEALVYMYDKCIPGATKNYIKSLMGSISDDIQRNIDEGKEILNPKY
jgi:hypothetical protein